MDIKMNLRRVLIRIALTACVLAGSAATAAAQSTVRVTHDETAIWAPDFRTKTAVVPAGTILTVIRRRDDWFEVVVPQPDGGSGYVYKLSVDAEPGSRSSESQIDMTSAEPSRAFGIVGVAQFGYVRFAAGRSFGAVLGDAGGRLLGGGAEVRVGPAFLSASIERFEKTGQRILVVDDEVFKLGIPETVRIVPVSVSAGLRFSRDVATPYVGVGVGRMFYKEQSSFADDGEKVDARFSSYHVLGGVEIRNGWVATAFEAQYTHAPQNGIGGALQAFHESNLGGLTARIKVLVGR